MNMAARSPRPAAAATNCAASDDLPEPAGPMKSVLVPRSRPPPSSASSSGTSLDDGLGRELVPVLGRDEAREDLDAARLDV